MSTRRDPSGHHPVFAIRAFLALALLSAGRATGQGVATPEMPSRRIEVPWSGKVRTVSIGESRIAVALDSGDIQILDRDTGRAAIPTIRRDPAPNAVALSPDGRRLAIGGPREVVREIIHGNFTAPPDSRVVPSGGIGGGAGVHCPRSSSSGGPKPSCATASSSPTANRSSTRTRPR